MKITTSFIIVFLSAITVRAQYASEYIKLLSHWDSSGAPAEPIYDIRYSSCWGYSDPVKAKKYGIIGSSMGTHFIEITDPSKPVQRDYVAGRRDNCIWREYKTYKNFLYMVSDDQAPNSLQIADLSYLPDSVNIIHDSDSILQRAHTVFIEGDNLYCASVKGGSVGSATMAVFDLWENPGKPKLLRKLNDDYPGLVGHVHDMFVRNDTVYASCGFDGLYIFRFENRSKFVQIGSFTGYPRGGYNHSSVLTPDGNYLIFADEVPRSLPVKVLDVTDFSNLTITDTIVTRPGTYPGSTPHNPFMKGNVLFISAYLDGVYSYSMNDPLNPKQVGFFDTYPQNGNNYPDDNVYQGCWSVYVDYQEDIIIASDMTNGMFVLDVSLAMPVSETEIKKNGYVFKVSNLLINNYANLLIESPENESIEYEWKDILGKNIAIGKINLQKGTNHSSISVPQTISSGIYLLNLRSEKVSTVVKMVKAP
ncbi:MAG: hypothetical protein A3H98_02295 [Bacteroidetes bacterium RIFCSPLOWO2_02_FULL_36_8]|nr:MAG: hypothetical protein A3H98_02295 [Bacteroidetes bacterium RIFCSPLOWO2_02_FULL_36_8]OFY69178.1 MAG: hypothetical protein A3G23_06425 [Bacteroidetes bacterium RIFCSPLOWO2_12_FULL_37_12]